MNFPNLVGTIAVEAAVISTPSLITAKWRYKMKSKRDYNMFINQFYCNFLNVYSPEQVCAIIYAASITDPK